LCDAINQEDAAKLGPSRGLGSNMGGEELVMVEGFAEQGVAVGGRRAFPSS